MDSVRAEVSASLEGCLEAKTLERFISELERFAEDAERVALSTTGGMPEVPVEQTALPPGCRAEAPKLKERNGNGQVQGVAKSKVQIAREKDLRVGKYGIDRIRI